MPKPLAYILFVLSLTASCSADKAGLTLGEWRTLPEPARYERLVSLSYDERARPLVEAVAADFIKVYGGLPGIRGAGVSIQQGGTWMVEVDRAFIVDMRKIPSMHLSVPVHMAIAPADTPPEFNRGPDGKTYIWAPPHYEAYVDRAADEIRAKLGAPDMSREEMLHALIGEPFENFKAHVEEGIRKGFIKDYR